MKRILVLVLLTLPLPLLSQTGSAPQYGTEIQALLAIPTGKSTDVYSLGFGAQAAMFYDFEENLRFTASLGYVRMGLDGDGIRNKVEQAGKGTADLSGATNGFPLIIGLRLITPGKGMRFYGAVEGGLYLYSSSIEGTYTQADGTMIHVDQSEFRSEPGFNAAIGFLSELGENVYFNAAARYHFVQDSQYYSGSPWGNTVNVSTSQYFSISLGVSYSYDL
jgi:hypothetical protein